MTIDEEIETLQRRLHDLSATRQDRASRERDERSAAYRAWARREVVSGAYDAVTLYNPHDDICAETQLVRPQRRLYLNRSSAVGYTLYPHREAKDGWDEIERLAGEYFPHDWVVESWYEGNRSE